MHAVIRAGKRTVLGQIVRDLQTGVPMWGHRAERDKEGIHRRVRFRRGDVVVHEDGRQWTIISPGKEATLNGDAQE